MLLGVGRGQNIGHWNYCHIWTLLPPGASVFHKHILLKWCIYTDRCLLFVSQNKWRSNDNGQSSSKIRIIIIKTRCVCETPMPPATTKSKMAIFRLKVTVKVTRSSTMVSSRKGFIRVFMPNMKSLSLTVQKLWPSWKFLLKIAIFRTWGHGRGHKAIDLGVIWKGFISRVCMPNMKCFYLLRFKSKV